VYETDGGMPLVRVGDMVKRGDTIISKKRLREITQMKIEKLERELEFTYPDLKTVDVQSYTEDRKEKVRELETLYNCVIALDDVTSLGDGEVILVDEERVVIREYQR
jgi:hypothetical protein